MSSSFEDVITQYLEHVDAGLPPDRKAFLRAHEAHAEQLCVFFANEDLVTGYLAQPPSESVVPVPDRAGGLLQTATTTLEEDAAEGYTIVRRLGAGGMGVVYEAEQQYPRRRVALKVIRGGRYVSERHIRLFRREVETLARLEHPSIAAIYAASLTADGHHFFAMEFVDGQRLDLFVRGRMPTLDLKLRLFQDICAGVHYAHQRDVIHRDLKPSNILVTTDADGAPTSGTPRVKILDFGLARITDAEIGEATLVTEVGRIQGTLQYMSPEQARGEADVMDRRTDVYSLGMILYELIASRAPYDVRACPLHQAVRVICEHPITPPSECATANRHAGMRGAAGVSPELDTIALKALEKDPDQRYQTAQDLADDIERCLTNKPIRARAPSLPYRARKFIARHRVGLLVSLLVGTLIGAFAVVLAIQSVRFAGQRRETERARADEATLRKVIESGQARIRRADYASRISRAHQAWKDANLSNALRLLEATRPGPGEEDLRGFGWFHLWRTCHRDAATLSQHESPVLAVTFSPDGKWIASGSLDSAILLWSRQTGRIQARLSGHTDEARAVAFSRDGARLASASADGTVKLWDVATASEIATLTGHTAAVNSVAFSHDGRSLATGSHDHTAILWDLDARKPRTRFTGHQHEVRSVAFAPDGRTLATGSWDAKVKLWDVETGTARRTLEGHRDGICAVRFSPDGGRLASASYDRSARLWDVGTGHSQDLRATPEAVVQTVAFSPDGTTLATAGDDTVVRLWDVATGTQRSVIKGHLGRIHGMAWSPDGAALATASSDGTIKLWDPAMPPDPITLHTYRGPVMSLAFAPDSDTLVAGILNYAIQIWHVSRNEYGFSLLERHSAHVHGVAYSPDGTRFASASADGSVKLWTATSPHGPVMEEATLDAGAGEVRAVAFAPDGATIATASADHRVRLWDLRTMEIIATLSGHTAAVRDVAYAPHGTWLVSTSDDRSAIVWDLETLGPYVRLGGHGDAVTSAAFSPDGTRLATASQDETLRIWNVAAGRIHATLAGHALAVFCVAFSPDGRVLASGSADRTVKLWDAVSGHERMTLSGHTHSVRALAFSPDGRVLASGDEDFTVRLWRAAPAGSTDPAR